jgi:hypothetical protein
LELSVFDELFGRVFAVGRSIVRQPGASIGSWIGAGSIRSAGSTDSVIGDPSPRDLLAIVEERRLESLLATQHQRGSFLLLLEGELLAQLEAALLEDVMITSFLASGSRTARSVAGWENCQRPSARTKGIA